ncbi:MAG: luciferase family protein [Pseudomonadota bacterium]
MNTRRRPWRFAAAALMITGLALVSARAEEARLPVRDGETPVTTNRVPHIQIGAKAVPRLTDRLLQRVGTLPGVKVRATVISLPGARGFWLSEDIDLANPQAIVGGREFAHIHPDGSLHASLRPDRARAAVKAGWAVLHPWANSRPGWEGFVLLFTPRTVEETDVVFQLLVDGYNYVTGRSHTAADP